MTDTGDTLAVILAGGKGSRLGFKDKAMLMLDGKPLISLVLAKLKKQCGEIVISANGDLTRFNSFNVPIISDEYKECGPLAGILTGLTESKKRQKAYLLTLPVDSPFFPDDLLASLKAKLTPEVDIAYAMAGGRSYPVFALWRATLGPAVRENLAAGNYKIDALWPKYKVAFHEWDEKKFFNINTPSDIENAWAISRAE